MIYTVVVVGVMTKFLFTTKFFIDKKLDKHKTISKPISKRLYIKISLLFVVVVFNLLTQLYRLVQDVIVCLAYVGVKGIDL